MGSLTFQLLLGQGKHCIGFHSYNVYPGGVFLLWSRVMASSTYGFSPSGALAYWPRQERPTWIQAPFWTGVSGQG